jgi:lipopolysaccharide/colanic/teichoic acid biosynthesis glycosyltransferase
MSMAASESYISNLYAEDALPAVTRRRAFSSELYRSSLIYAEPIADVLTCIASIFAAYSLQLHFGGLAVYPEKRVMAVGIVYGLFTVLLLKAAGAYGRSNSLMRIRETENAVRAAIQSTLLLLLVSFVLQLHFPRLALCISVVLAPLLLILQKQILYFITRALHVRGYWADRVVIYGAGEKGKRIASTLLNSPKLGLHPIAVWSDGFVPPRDDISVLGYRGNISVPIRRESMTPTLLRSLHCDLLIVAVPDISIAAMDHMTRVSSRAGIPMASLSDAFVRAGQWQRMIDIDGLLLALSANPSETWHYAIAKRVVDVVLSSFLLIVLSPFLLLVALLIRLGSPGPALFVQKRVGRDGELFDMYKFRSMHRTAPMYATSPVRSTDPRITRFGRFLRKTSLDELPQLINVFMGKMSLVGPRPEMPFVVAGYNGHQRVRLHAVST